MARAFVWPAGPSGLHSDLYYSLSREATISRSGDRHPSLVSPMALAPLYLRPSFEIVFNLLYVASVMGDEVSFERFREVFVDSAALLFGVKRLRR